MENTNAPRHPYTICETGYWLFGKVPNKSPNSRRTRTATKRKLPIPVKSILVWKAKIVRPRQIAAVIPTASKTELTLR